MSVSSFNKLLKMYIKLHHLIAYKSLPSYNETSTKAMCQPFEYTRIRGICHHWLSPTSQIGNKWLIYHKF